MAEREREGSFLLLWLPPVIITLSITYLVLVWKTKGTKTENFPTNSNLSEKGVL